MICPECSNAKTKVRETRDAPGGTRRRLYCPSCEKRFTSLEVVVDCLQNSANASLDTVIEERAKILAEEMTKEKALELARELIDEAAELLEVEASNRRSEQLASEREECDRVNQSELSEAKE